MGLLLFRSDTNDDAAVRDFSASWDLRFADEEYSFCAGWHSAANALGEAAKFIGKGRGPELLVRALDQVLVFLGLARFGIDDGMGKVVAMDWRALC